MNSEARPRPPMDPQLRRQLIEEFTPEIERLGRLIDRDLSAWVELPPAQADSAQPLTDHSQEPAATSA